MKLTQSETHPWLEEFLPYPICPNQQSRLPHPMDAIFSLSISTSSVSSPWSTQHMGLESDPCDFLLSDCSLLPCVSICPRDKFLWIAYGSSMWFIVKSSKVPALGDRQTCLHINLLPVACLPFHSFVCKCSKHLPLKTWKSYLKSSSIPLSSEFNV